MPDLKELYQIKADKIAEERYDMDFYSLPLEMQSDVWEQAEEAVTNDLAYQADAIKDRIEDR